MNRQRPWDRKRKSRPTIATNDSATQRATTPSIEVDGTRYLSDRFYLHHHISATATPGPDDADTTAATPTEQHACCHCGAQQPPPLLCRSRLVQSLQLRAAIVGTYTISDSIESIRSQYPSLVSGDVPCVILHGKKGWKPPTPRTDTENISMTSTASDNSDIDSILGEPIDEVEDMENKKASTGNHATTIPSNVHFAEVTSSWLPTSVALRDAVCPSTGTLRPSIIQQRLPKRGVHHPKYMLLFETSGSVVVIVSTANFGSAPGFATDASWIQRFYPYDERTNVDRKRARPSASDGDVGTVFAHLLRCSTLATAAEQMTVYGFCRRYFSQSIDQVLQTFDFRPTTVSLVATVPGDYKSSSLFGLQRMRHLVSSMPWALKDPAKDRLILQPTSFGAEWKDKNLIDLARSYLETKKNEKAVLRRLEIMWPTLYFVEQARTRQATLEQELTFAPSEKRSTADSTVAVPTDGGYLFLSSLSFNKIGVDCLSRMSMYEPNAQTKVLVPHFKSIVRVYGGCDYAIRKTYGLPKCDEYFSWFLLTSACLSRGAQGERQRENDDEDDTVSYMNFELGVLFQTQLGGTKCADNRLYCFQPSRCVCGTDEKRATSSSTAQLVHLPCPYNFHPPMYVENAAEEIVFRETPYFHEIVDGTGSMGNMKLTPLGQRLSQQFD